MSEFYVYCLENRKNGKLYVGKGSGKRAFVHAYYASTGNTSCPALYAAIRKHGIEAFVTHMLALGLSEAEAHSLECWFIQELGSFGSGYNLTAGGEGASGFKRSQAEKDAASARWKAYFAIPANREAASKRRLGMKFSPEHIANMAASKRGTKQSPEVVERRIAPLRGRIRPHNEETKRKISVTLTGRPVPEETCKKISQVMLDRELQDKIVACWDTGMRGLRKIAREVGCVHATVGIALKRAGRR